MYYTLIPPVRETPDDETELRRRNGERFPCRCDRADGDRAGKEADSAAAKDEGLRREVERREGEDRRQGPRRLPDLHEHLPQGVRARADGGGPSTLHAGFRPGAGGRKLNAGCGRACV